MHKSSKLVKGIRQPITLSRVFCRRTLPVEAIQNQFSKEIYGSPGITYSKEDRSSPATPLRNRRYTLILDKLIPHYPRPFAPLLFTNDTFFTVISVKATRVDRCRRESVVSELGFASLSINRGLTSFAKVYVVSNVSRFKMPV